VFKFHLERPDGTLAEPSTLTGACPDWEPGNTIHLWTRALRVVAVRASSEPDANAVLAVEDVAESGRGLGSPPQSRPKPVGAICTNPMVRLSASRETTRPRRAWPKERLAERSEPT
jgi:hypothetical protein